VMLSAGTQDALRIDLVEDVLRRFGSARLCVQGSSMLPSLRPGDEIQVQSIPLSEIKMGDVVAYRRDERLFVHRVIGTDALGRLVTRGDTLPQADAPVSESELLGSIVAVSRDGERVEHRRSLAGRTAAAIFQRSRFCAALFVKLACVSPRLQAWEHVRLTDHL
jgi:signal peptidase I